MDSTIPILIAAIAIATVLNVLLRRLALPTVLGYIATGTLLGAFLDLEGDEDLQHVAEFGVVFLMFSIGLEFSFTRLRTMRREVFLFGTTQVFFTAAAIAGLAYALFGMADRTAILVGAALALSSTAIVLKVLTESGQARSEAGRNAIGILIFQDLAVIPILLMVTLFTSRDRSLLQLLVQTSLNAAAVIALLYFGGRFLIGTLLRVVSETNSREIYVGFILLIVVGASELAHDFGFSYSLGAFLTGMMIADTIYRYRIEADLIPFRDLLLGVFFVSIGLQIDVPIVLRNLGTIAALTVVLMSIKAAVLFAVLLPFCSGTTSLKTALSLAQLGEFSLVVLSLVLANGLLPPAEVQILMVTVATSMVLAPILLNQADNIVRIVQRGHASSTPFASASLFGGHVVLLGFGTLGQLLSRSLREAGIEHVVVTDGTDEYAKAREMDCMAVFGDPGDPVLLQQVEVRRSMSTIIALDDIDDVKRASAAIALVAPETSVIARVASATERDELEGFEHRNVVDGTAHTAELIVGQIRRSRLLAEETAALRFMKDLDGVSTDEAIGMIGLEQRRLLEIISHSFGRMRERRDVMEMKALHESFGILSELIADAIASLLAGRNLSQEHYETVSTLLQNHTHLVRVNTELEALARELLVLAEDEETRSLTTMAVEGLDAVLLTLSDLAASYSETDMQLLESMTSGRRLAEVRATYLTGERSLARSTRAVLVSATNRIDRLRALFGEIGTAYRSLARAAPAADHGAPTDAGRRAEVGGPPRASRGFGPPS